MMITDGHDITIFTPLYKKIEEEDLDIGIKIKRIKPVFKLGNGAFIPSLLWSLSSFDLVYLHYPFFGGSEILWLFKLLNKKTKLIVHYHMDILGLSPFARLLSIPSRLIEKSLLKKADLITAASLDYVENSDIAYFYKDNKEKFRQTYFGVDTEKFHPLDQKEKQVIKKILFVGGLDKAHYFKGLSVLIDSLSKIKDRDDWVLEIVGKGDLQQKFIEDCIEKGIEKKVKFLGSVSNEELPRVYREASFFVLPSVNKGEAFGIVLLEAMASGLPLIASNLAGVRSVFVEGEQGLRVKPGDVDDLLEKVKVFLDNDDLLFKMAQKSRQIALEKYQNKKITDRFNNIIKELS